jgi:uncharacterized protein (DUF952 family)
MADLLHVTTEAEWAAAQRQGRIACPPGGFIHLCTAEQLEFVLGRHFAGRTSLLALRLDPAGLDVRWETSEPGMDDFPHLYGALPTGSVRAADPV